jgi:hypothetical protein
MRSVAVCVTAASMAAAGLAPADARDSATRRPGCHPAGAKTITKSARARVFKYRRLVWGCLYRRNRAVPLTADDGYGTDFLRPPKPQLAGRFVAYTYYWEGSVEGTGQAVRVTDLRSGATNLTDFEFEENDKVPTDVKVVKLVVTPTGWVAWSWMATYDKSGDVPEIRRLRAGRSDIGLKAKPLDSGPDVDPASLERDGTSIFWMHGDEARTAELGP